MELVLPWTVFPQRCCFLVGLLLSTSLLRASAEGAAEAEEDEASEVTPVSVSISVMLLGNIGFQMLLFYLVHHWDKDIKRYSWQVISSTISIFCAVLLFQGVNGLVETYVIESPMFEGVHKPWEIFMDLLQFVFWLALCQLVLAITSGAVREEVWLKPAESIRKVELDLKSYSVLFSHLAAFASINAWGSWQQHVFSSSWSTALLAVPFGFFIICCFYKLCDMIRIKISLSDDGVTDEFEEKWDEETEEAENDVAGMSLSFLTVQAIRFYLDGDLPDQEGADKNKTDRTASECMRLFLSGLGFFLLALVVMRIRAFFPQEEEEDEENEEAEGEEGKGEQVETADEGEDGKKEEEEKYELPVRFCNIMNNYSMMGQAWCFFYSALWYISAFKLQGGDTLAHVVNALFLSAMSFAFIFLLDKIEDNHWLGKQKPNKAIQNIIKSLGILVGFSWEQSFDVCIDVIAESTESGAKVKPCWTKLWISVILVLVVFPAWRHFILPKEQALSDEIDAEQKQERAYEEKVNKASGLYMDPERHEKDLDQAHLWLKVERRRVFGLANTIHRPGLTHLVVSSRGVTMANDHGRRRSKLHEHLIPDTLKGEDERGDNGAGPGAAAPAAGASLLPLIAWSNFKKGASAARAAEGGDRTAPARA